VAGALGRLSTSVTLQQCLDKIAEANGAWAWASGPACGTPDGGADTRAKVPVR
jgi:hypothetical protein